MDESKVATNPVEIERIKNTGYVGEFQGIKLYSEDLVNQMVTDIGYLLKEFMEFEYNTARLERLVMIADKYKINLN